jgi:hypothetical protein
MQLVKPQDRFQIILKQMLLDFEETGFGRQSRMMKP